MSKERVSQKEKEEQVAVGTLVVITGRSGSGKDTVVDQVLETIAIVQLGFRRVVTHASRNPRPGEIPGKSYYFVSHEELFALHESGGLVEAPVQTGTSHKATSKKELLQILSGERLIWRVEPGMAAQVATGQFFDENFTEEIAAQLKARSRVIYIDADQAALERRRKGRAGDEDSEEYRLRDEAELALLKQVLPHFTTRIVNLEGQLEQTVDQALKIITELVKSDRVISN